MKILIITYYYSPWLNPRAIRWTSLANAFANNGHEVDILCSSKKGAISEDNENGNINIYYTGRIRSNRERAIENKNENIKSPIFRLKRIVKNILKFFHSVTWKKIYWPDHACLWYFSAVRIGNKLLRQNKYDLLISVSLPFTSHLVASKLTILNPGLKWIVDIGDPFYFLSSTPINNHRIYTKLNFNVENSILTHATCVSVTNLNVLHKYSEIFPECKNKIYVIPPVLSAAKTNHNNYFSDNRKIRFVYIGTLYKEIRSPETMLSMFNYLVESELKDNIELHIIGDITNCMDWFNNNNLVGEKIFLPGVMEHNIVNEILHDNVFLINIGNKTSFQLPSKIIEYVSSGNPIINIISNNFDNTLDFLENYPLVMKIKDSLESNQFEQIKEFVLKNNQQKVPNEILEPILQPYRPDTVSKQYISIMNNAH